MQASQGSSAQLAVREALAPRGSAPQTLTGLRSDLFLPSCRAPGPGRCRWLHLPGSAGSDPHLGKREHRQRWQELRAQLPAPPQGMAQHLLELGMRRRRRRGVTAMSSPGTALPCPPALSIPARPQSCFRRPSSPSPSLPEPQGHPVALKPVRKCRLLAAFPWEHTSPGSHSAAQQDFCFSRLKAGTTLLPCPPGCSQC